jgi:hypothetical protein
MASVRALCKMIEDMRLFGGGGLVVQVAERFASNFWPG